MKRRTILVAGALVILLGNPAPAYIERMYSLREVLDESTNVLVGKIEAVDSRRRTAVARIERPLKGRKEFERVQMNLGLGPGSQARYLLDVLEEGKPFILFYSRQGGSIASVGHSGDTWFQLYAGYRGDPGQVWWRFSHLEIYMGRTFNGPTPDLIQLTGDVLSGRRRPPPPNPRAPTLDFRRLRSEVARVATIPLVTVVPARTTWRYLKGTREASGSGSRRGAWRTLGFDDSSWPAGRAPVGYGDRPLGTTLGDMQQRAGKPGYASVFLRHRFRVPRGARVETGEFRIDYDDGFIVWLNGTEVLSANRPRGAPAHDALASGNHESGAREGFPLGNARRHLVNGDNVLAVQVFNVSLSSTDLKFDLELKLGLEGPTGATVAAGRRGSFRKVVELSRSGGGEVRGISWVDLNGDELLDVYFSRSADALLLFNEGDGFSGDRGRFNLPAGTRSAAWADYNGDDHPDLLTSDFRVLASAGGLLREITKLPGLPATRNPEGAGWIDHNGDGLPDVLISNGESGIHLWENTGRGPNWFRDVSLPAGLGRLGLGRGNGGFVACADYDGDGYTDFLCNLGSGLLAHNEGDGTFRVDTTAGIRLSGGSEYKRGLTFADFDNDDDLDLFVPTPGAPALYRNQNDGTFTDVIATAGDLARLARASFSAAWGDVDHDGFLDLFVCRPGGASQLFLGDGKGRFQAVTAAVGLDDPGAVYAASLADVDGDGDLDLALNLQKKVLLAANELARRPGRGFLKVRLHVRRGLIGSTVRVTDPRGRPLGRRDVNGAESCGGQSPPVAHFGLPLGQCRVSVSLGDGRFARRNLRIPSPGLTLTLRDRDFQE